MFCTQCGHENTPGSRFCSSCGAALVNASADRGVPVASDETSVNTTSTISLGAIAAHPGVDDDASALFGDLAADDQAAVTGLPPDCALLVVVRGPSSGSRYLLDTETVTAGRHPDSDIFLDDVTVSRRHAEFRRLPEGSRCAMSAASMARTSTETASTTSCSATATRCRSESSGSCTS